MGNTNSASDAHGKKHAPHDKKHRPPMFDAANRAFDHISTDQKHITEHDLETNFGQELGHCLFRRYFNNKAVDRDEFVDQFYSLYEMRNETVIKLFDTKLDFLKACLSVMHASLDDDDFLHSFVAKMEEDHDFIDANCPGLVQNTILRYLRNVLSSSPQQIVYTLDSSILSPLQMLIVQGSLPEMVYFQNKRPAESKDPCWRRLYDSNHQGLSVNGFEGKVFGYTSPTVSIFKLNNGTVYVLAINQEWKHTTKFFGTTLSRCVQILPEYKVFDSRHSEPVFCNFKLRTSPFGMGFRDVFKVNEGLENALAIEVWGCGDDSVLQEQAVLKQRQRMQAERNQKVPLPGLWDENPDKAVLEMAGYQFSSERNRPEPPIEE